MSPQATYYPVEASELNRQYQFTFKPQVIPASLGIYRPSQIDVEVSQDNWTWTPFGSSNALPADTPNFAVLWGEVQGLANAQWVR